MSLFKSFNATSKSGGDISSSTSLKSSVQRSIRAKLLAQYPDTLGADGGVLLESIWPKKEDVTMVRFAREHVQFIVREGRPIFWQHFEGAFFPTLRLVHQYPNLLPTIRVDRGAIRFLLSGANIMAPGLVSAGGRLPDASAALPKDAPVVVLAQGKEHALAIGRLKLGTEEIKAQGKGVVVDNLHSLGDDLWLAEARGAFGA